MKNNDKDQDGKPVPRVEKYIGKDGRPVHSEHRILDDTSFFANFNEDNFGETISKIILHDVPERQKEHLKKHLGIASKSTKAVKPVKPFPQYLMNLEDKSEQFAEELRNMFCSEKGLEIRYMIEALKKSYLLTYLDRERADLYKSLKDYFNQNIGSKQGIFDKKTSDLPKDNIDSSLLKINSILEKLFPVR